MIQPDRLARIAEYERRAAAGMPLFVPPIVVEEVDL